MISSPGPSFLPVLSFLSLVVVSPVVFFLDNFVSRLLPSFLLLVTSRPFVPVVSTRPIMTKLLSLISRNEEVELLRRMLKFPTSFPLLEGSDQKPGTQRTGSWNGERNVEFWR